MVKFAHIEGARPKGSNLDRSRRDFVMVVPPVVVRFVAERLTSLDLVGQNRGGAGWDLAALVLPFVIVRLIRYEVIDVDRFGHNLNPTGRDVARLRVRLGLGAALGAVTGSWSYDAAVSSRSDHVYSKS